jgi:hypothetical protein
MTKLQLAHKLAERLPLNSHKLRKHASTHAVLIGCHAAISMHGGQTAQQLSVVLDVRRSEIERQLSACPYFELTKGKWVHAWPEADLSTQPIAA